MPTHTSSTVAGLEEAIELVQGLIVNIANRHCRTFRCSFDDAYQECVTLLCAKWPLYDPNKSAFTTWTMNICGRHLKQCYALGKLDGPAVRVSYPAFKRGERTKVFSLSMHEDWHDWNEAYLHGRETKPVANEAEFIEFAETLVGRRLTQIERHVYVSRFVDGKDYQEIAEIFPRNKSRRLKEVMQRFTTEARRNRHKTTRKQHASV